MLYLKSYITCNTDTLFHSSLTFAHKICTDSTVKLFKIMQFWCNVAYHSFICANCYLKPENYLLFQIKWKKAPPFICLDNFSKVRNIEEHLEYPVPKYENDFFIINCFAFKVFQWINFYISLLLELKEQLIWETYQASCSIYANYYTDCFKDSIHFFLTDNRSIWMVSGRYFYHLNISYFISTWMD